MEEYRISKSDLRKWCSIPVDELAGHPDRKMDLVVGEDKQAMLAEIGNLMADEVIEHNRLGRTTTWVLPGGPSGQYEVFINRVNSERISLKNLFIFHMDTWLDWEFRPFPPDNLRFSCEAKMTRGFYGKIDPELNVPPSQRFFPDPLKPDAFDDKIEELGGVDTLLGGVGCKGLVAFNEEPRLRYRHITLEEFARSRSRIVTLNEDTIIAYGEREFGACFEALPPNAFTIGMKSMLTAKRALFIVMTGSWKQTVVRVALFSEPTTEYPVTLFPRYVPRCVLYCDRATADHTISRHPELPILK